MKKLFVSDLDDTLVENGKVLPEHTIRELNRIFKDDKKELVIASARNYNSIIKRIKGLEKKIKIIARNGSLIYDENGVVIKFFNIEKDEIKKAIKYSLDNNLCPIVIEIANNKEILHTDKKFLNDERIKYAKESIRLSDDLENQKFKNVIGIYSFGNIVKEKIYELSGIKIIKDNGFIHFVNKNVDKGQALRELKNIYKYENITCFGNDENDYSMLNYCDNPYYIFNDNKNNKYNNIPFDNGLSILKVMEK